MDIRALTEIVRAALASPPFTISGQHLQSPAVTRVLTDLLNADRLVLTDAGLRSTTDTEVVVDGQLAQPLAGLQNQHATVTFAVLDAEAHLHLKLDRLPAGWTPSASFPVLSGSVFDDFRYSEPVLRMDSIGAPVLPTDYPGDLGQQPYSAAITGAMVPGLSLSATVTPTTPTGPLESLLSGSAWPMSGPILLPVDQLTVMLSSEPQFGLGIDGFSIRFKLSLASIAVQPQPDGPVHVTGTMQVDAMAERDVGGAILRLPLSARLGSGNEPMLMLRSQLPPGQRLTLGQVASLLTTALDGQVPQGFPALDEIQLEEVSLLLTPAVAQPLTALSVTVGVGQDPYSVFAGLLSFSNMSVTFTYQPDGFPRPDGTAGYVATCVRGTATLGHGTLDAEILLPTHTFFCQLASGPDTSIDIKSLVEQAIGPSISMPQVTCSELRLFGDVPNGWYRLQATVTDEWKFHIGSKPLALTEISMDLDRGPDGFGGQIACRCDIAGTQLYGRAEYDPATKGWSFSLGTLVPTNVNLSDLVADLVALLGLSLPSGFPEMILTSVNFSFDTAGRAFGLRCASSLSIAGATVDTALWVTDDEFQGLLWVGRSYFEIDFRAGHQQQALSAIWCATTEQTYLEFGDIAQALALPPPQLPAGLDLALKGAGLHYARGDDASVLVVRADSAHYGKAVFLAHQAGGTRRWAAGLAVGTPIELTELPLLGRLLSPGQRVRVTGLQVVLSTTDIDEDTARALNADIPEGYPMLPAAGTASPLGLTATIEFGDTTIPISLGMGDVADQGGQSSPDDTVVGQQSGGTPVPTTPARASDGTTWFKVQRSFGPMHLDKIGVRYGQGVLWFSIDGSLTAGGLTITLLGASIGSPVTDFQPHLGLKGLGIDFSRPPLEIGGGFAEVLQPSGGATFEYDGAVAITTSAWALMAYGSYAELRGTPSLFVFLECRGAFGGPPAFFVTGIVGGFGYNSRLRIPAETEVSSCPLVAGLSDPDAVGGAHATPLQAMNALTDGTSPWVSHALGETWVAAGLTFTTCELLQSVALLAVEFGSELTVALLGTSVARFPPEPDLPAYASIHLQLEAVLRPSRGFFGITANLGRDSFLFAPACMLTGGFAFFVWFSPSRQAGDFVVTLGGYHPAFVPPAHYPAEPRLGFSWSLDSVVRIRGEAYFALTPSAIMAGGSLSVTFQDDGLQAWFTGWVDLVIGWRPFHFRASIGVSIRVSYRLRLLFASVSLGAELGAELTLWGPPTRGEVRVHWSVISFTVTFGARTSELPGPLRTWDDFAALLPHRSDVVKLTALAGLAVGPTTAAAVPADGAGYDGPWLVRGSAFSFSTRSALPITELYVGSQSTRPLHTGDRLDIRPLHRSGLTSRQRLTLTLHGTERDQLADGWTIEPLTADVPKALWGKPDGPPLDPGDAQLVTGQQSGLVLRAPAPVLGWTGGGIDVAGCMGFRQLAISGVTPIAASDPPSGDLLVAGRNAVELIEHDLAASGAVRRDALFAALAELGVSPATNGPLTRYAAVLGHLFTDEPLLVTEAP